MEYDVIIGLEIHAELKTKSKMFCACDNDSREAAPNVNVCPICLGHPGTLPVPNKQAIAWTILVGQALGCQINALSKFDRKNYFYPDLPKNYQISQYDLPFCHQGSLDVDGREVQITRIHLEEDTAKSIHPAKKKYTLVDFNRGGTPLIEMVTEPVIKSAKEAKRFCQIYQQILRYLDISNADMEKGEMRCEANVSVQEKGKWKYEGDCQIKPLGKYKLNPKVELKNINSFKAIEKAIDYEVKRQIEALTNNEELVQETRGWNEDKAETVRQRVKETSADYRYFPEPDIPPFKLDSQWIESIKAGLIELPPQKKKRFIEEYSFSDDASEQLVADKSLADYTEEVISELRAWIEVSGDTWERQKVKLAKTAANWILSELLKHLNEHHQTISDIKITPENFAEFIALVHQGKVNSSAAQTILKAMYEKGGDPSDIMKDMGLEQLDDMAELDSIITDVLAKNQKQAEEYKSGKQQVIQYLVGLVMAATKGKANPKIVLDILKSKLNN